ncbi:hypothetical protein BHE74_00011407 [Ensete ventricosum]|nr:hypothetical protein BHE74_00011407 [Ensete ventricosum]RZR89455.1 hypothetical protein BHM03_00017203 [Ensete ventricosum]
MASIDDHRRARIVDMDPTPRQKPDRSILRALETRMGGEEFHLKIAHPTATTANLKTARGDVTAQPSPRNRWSPSAWMPRMQRGACAAALMIQKSMLLRSKVVKELLSEEAGSVSRGPTSFEP